MEEALSADIFFDVRREGYFAPVAKATNLENLERDHGDRQQDRDRCRQNRLRVDTGS